MARENIVTGIDIGSHYIYTVVGVFNPENALPQIIGLGKSRAAGIRKGVIIDAEDAAASIKKSVREAEQSSGVTVSSALVSVEGDHIVSMMSRGVVAVSRADGEISTEDVERVMGAAKTVALPANREILHNIPHQFVVDGEEGLRDVVGMTGLRLEADNLIIGGSSAHMKNLQKCMQENNIEVDGFLLAPITAASAVLSKRQKELGVLCLDMGGGTTGMSVYEEGNLIHANVVPIGGDNITNDLAIGLRVGVDIAERIKREYGTAISANIPKRETIELAKFDPNETDVVSRRDVVEIMEDRLNEIFDQVNKELRKIGKEASYLPAGVVLTGGSAKIPHIVDLCKEKLRLPVQIGFPRDVEGVVGSIDDPSFAVALGLLFEGFEDMEVSKGKRIPLPVMPKLGNPAEHIKKWLRSLLP